MRTNNFHVCNPVSVLPISKLVKYHAIVEAPGLGHASICPDQCAYDTNNSRIQRQCVRI